MKDQTSVHCPYVCLYESYTEMLRPYSDAERGRLVMAMLGYMHRNEEPEFAGNERYLWPALKGQIDRDKAAYENRCKASRENGKKGGRPRKEKPKKPMG